MFDFLKDHIYPQGRFAIIVDRSKLEDLWVWFIKNYHFTNTLTDFKDFSKFLKDQEKTFLLLDFSERNFIFIRDYKSKDQYNDWNNWKIINFKEVLREEKIKEIFK
jgi:hypothetical protein